jgi:predicted nucleic-acid-binding Zn-ribbon protein
MNSNKKDNKKYYDIECTNCGAIMLTPKQHMLSDNKLEIIEMWNKRV